MKSIVAWQGDTISLTVDAPDDTADTATLLVGLVGEEAIFSKTSEFNDEVADLTITDEENVIPVGEYTYVIKVSYTDGAELTFPKPSSCDPSELPGFIIKEAITEGS